MQIDFDLLMKYTEDGRLRHSEGAGDLHVWCYSQQTVYSRDWDDLTLLCRGLVTDGEGVVISRPFRKFFNWGEPLAPGPDVTDRPFRAYDKEDGTLIVAGQRDGELVVSTKGSFSTWHSEVAREMLGDWRPRNGMTGVFEFIHPDNRIVVDYGDFAGLVLLGAVDNEDGSDHYTPEDFAEVTGWTGRLATPRVFNLHTMLRTVQDSENGPNREGFVLVWHTDDYAPSPRVKIKFAQYVQLHAVLSRLSNVAVWEALKAGTFDALLEIVPDEMYDKVRECAEELTLQYEGAWGTAMFDHQIARTYETRKEAAAWILECCEYPALVFGLLDGRDVSSKIWDLVRPERDTTWTFLK